MLKRKKKIYCCDVFNSTEDCDDSNAMVNPDAKVEVYPNPATDYLSIKMESPEFKSLEITIYNVLGEVLYKKEASFLSGQNLMEIDVQSYTNGVYWLEISTENGKRRQVESFIKL